MMRCWLVLFCWPMMLLAKEPDIQFVSNVTWKEVMTKARVEHKLIFIYYYAEGNRDAGKMNREVLSKVQVSNECNEQFVNVKITVDSAGNKEEASASLIQSIAGYLQLVDVRARPGFLFFSPDGKILHREEGFRDEPGFLSVIKNAVNSERQYYSLLKRYREGTKEYSTYPYLATTARVLHDSAVAEEVSSVYTAYVLGKYVAEQRMSRKDIEFLSAFMRKPSDAGMRFFLDHGAWVDTIMGVRHYARSHIDAMVYSTVIDSLLISRNRSLTPATEPDWGLLEKHISQLFNEETAERNVNWAKIRWYEDQKRWKEYCSCVVEKVEKYGPYEKHFPNNYYLESAIRYNAAAWEVFSYCTDNVQLNKALLWSEKAMQQIAEPNAEFYDTYANLLYKMGRVKEALQYEEKALLMDPRDKYIQVNLDKMKKGDRTWKN